MFSNSMRVGREHGFDQQQEATDVTHTHMINLVQPQLAPGEGFKVG